MVFARALHVWILLAALGPAPAHAEPPRPGCHGAALRAELNALYDGIFDFERVVTSSRDPEHGTPVYSRARRVAVLADGTVPGAQEGTGPVGLRIANMYPHLEVHRSDIALPAGRAVNGRLVTERVDLSRAEWFEASRGKFDLVILKNGMCACKPTGHSCAGTPLNLRDAVLFLERVVSLFTAGNREAAAYLHGPGEKNVPERTDVWRQAVVVFRERHPELHVRMHEDPTRIWADTFRGIQINVR
jgi:hypothetical protein